MMSSDVMRLLADLEEVFSKHVDKALAEQNDLTWMVPHLSLEVVSQDEKFVLYEEGWDTQEVTND